MPLCAYTQDLRYFLRWCAERDVEPLLAERPHLELHLRWMEQQGLAPATIGRRFTTVAGFSRYAVIDGRVQKDPSLAVTRRSAASRLRDMQYAVRHADSRTTPLRHGPRQLRPARSPRPRRYLAGMSAD